MSLLTREQLIQTAQLKTTDVEVTGGTVRLLEWDGVVGDEYSEMLREIPDGNGTVHYADDKWRCRVLCLSMCDESNKLLFDTDEWEAVSKGLSFADKVKAYNATMKLNGIIEEDDEGN